MAATWDPQQARDALDRANDVRIHVAEFKGEVAGLPRHEAIAAVTDALDHRHDDPLLGAARIRHLLLAVQGIGVTKAGKLLQLAQITNPDKRLRDLTARQRGLLVSWLETQGWRS